MKSLVLYDSQFGNTEKIAKAIGAGLGDDVKVVSAKDVPLSDLKSLDLLIVGSPTQGGRPTQALQQFFNSIPPDSLKNIKVAAFDTRFSEKAHNFGLRLIMNIFKYAAGRIANTLETKGGILAIQPEGFFVIGKEGPLKQGELERAMVWAKKLHQQK